MNYLDWCCSGKKKLCLLGHFSLSIPSLFVLEMFFSKSGFWLIETNTISNTLTTLSVQMISWSRLSVSERVGPERLVLPQWAVFFPHPVKLPWKMHGPLCRVGGDSCTVWLSHLIRDILCMHSQKLTKWRKNSSQTHTFTKKRQLFSSSSLQGANSPD